MSSTLGGQYFSGMLKVVLVAVIFTRHRGRCGQICRRIHQVNPGVDDHAGVLLYKLLSRDCWWSLIAMSEYLSAEAAWPQSPLSPSMDALSTATERCGIFLAFLRQPVPESPCARLCHRCSISWHCVVLRFLYR